MHMMKEKPPLAKEAVLGWIEHILTQKRWTGTDLARNSGLAPSTILRMMNDPNHHFTPSLRTLKKISEGANYPIPTAVLRALEVGRIEPSNDDEMEESPPPREPKPMRAQQRRLLRVRSVSALPKALHSTTTQMVSVPALPQLEDDQTAFAFYLPESTLEPWWKAGDLIYATRRRDPASGDVVLITKTDGRSMVRAVVEVSEEGIVVSKTHPVKAETTVPFEEIADWGIVQAVVRS